MPWNQIAPVSIGERRAYSQVALLSTMTARTSQISTTTTGSKGRPPCARDIHGALAFVVVLAVFANRQYTATMLEVLALALSIAWLHKTEHETTPQQPHAAGIELSTMVFASTTVLAWRLQASFCFNMQSLPTVLLTPRHG